MEHSTISIYLYEKVSKKGENEGEDEYVEYRGGEEGRTLWNIRRTESGGEDYILKTGRKCKQYRRRRCSMRGIGLLRG